MSAVKQCAYLLFAPSQVIQGSLKFCQCWLQADQSTDGPESPFPKIHRKRAVLCKAKGWCSHSHTPYIIQRPRESSAPHQQHPQQHSDPHQLCAPQTKHWLLLNNSEKHLVNGDDQFRSLCLSFPWLTILHNLFPGDNPASAMIARGECMTQSTFSKIRPCPSLRLLPNQISRWHFFIAENNHHWIHSVLMTYTCHRGCCSKNNRTDSSLNTCSLAIHFLSLYSGSVKLCSSCTFPQTRLYWLLLEASWAAGWQTRPTKASLVPFLLSLHPSLPMLKPWRTVFYSVCSFVCLLFNSSERKKNTILKIFPFAMEKD